MSGTIKPRVLRLATSDLDARPLFWNEGPLRFGYEPEAATAVADAVGLTLEWVYTDWAGRMTSVLSGDADGVWCGVAVTEERREILDFSAPYAYFHEACVVRQGVQARSPAEAAGLRIGAAAESTNLDMVRSWQGVHAVSFSADTNDIFADLIEATASGEIDGFVDDEPAMVPLAERDSRLAFGFTVETKRPWACGVKRGNTQLADVLNDGLSRCLTAGVLQRIWNAHLPFLDFPLLRDR